MSDKYGNWPAIAINPTQHPPVPLTKETQTEIKWIFRKKRIAYKIPGSKFLRSLEIALGRYQTNRMIQTSFEKTRTRDELDKINETAQELLKHLNEASITTKLMLGESLQQRSSDKEPKSWGDLANAAIETIKAASRATKYVQSIKQQTQYARVALACDVGEAIADLTKGGIPVSGDPDTGRPNVNKSDDGILNKVFVELNYQVTGQREKWPRAALEEGLERLQHLRSLERLANSVEPDVARGAASKLEIIDRLKDAVARDKK